MSPHPSYTPENTAQPMFFNLPTAKNTIRQVHRFVNHNSLLYIEWDNWYVGVTNNLPKRLACHRNRYGRDFRIIGHWSTRSPEIAAAVEKHFLQKGMNGSGGGWTHNSIHIYVFKISGPYS